MDMLFCFALKVRLTPNVVGGLTGSLVVRPNPILCAGDGRVVTVQGHDAVVIGAIADPAVDVLDHSSGAFDSELACGVLNPNPRASAQSGGRLVCPVPGPGYPPPRRV